MLLSKHSDIQIIGYCILYNYIYMKLNRKDKIIKMGNTSVSTWSQEKPSPDTCTSRLDQIIRVKLARDKTVSEQLLIQMISKELEIF